MSHFIANTISISKDFKTFKVKGGDNNVIPRSNEWTSEISLNELYYNVQGGMIKLNNSNEKACFINHLISENCFGGNWEEKTIYYYAHSRFCEGKGEEDPLKTKYLDFQKRFMHELIEGLKELSTKKDFIVQVHGQFIKELKKGGCYRTTNKNNAQKFTKYKAIQTAKKYSESKAIPEHEEPRKKQPVKPIYNTISRAQLSFF